MDRKNELKQQYKETKIDAGIYQIKNTVNEKIFIGSTPNLKSLNGIKFMLDTDGHTNKLLQEEWKEFGKEVFIFEIVEVLKQKEIGYSDPKRDLAKLENKWLEELQPYGIRGYNKEKA